MIGENIAICKIFNTLQILNLSFAKMRNKWLIICNNCIESILTPITIFSSDFVDL